MVLRMSNASPTTPEGWQDEVKRLLKAELRRRDMTYQDLVDRLSAIGVEQAEPNLRNKLSRGNFTAVFLVQCLTAIGCSTLRLERPSAQTD